MAEQAKNDFSYPIDGVHAQSAAAVVAGLLSDAKRGLSDGEGQSRLKRFGTNDIRKANGRSPFLILLSQFKGPFVVLLFIAAALSSWFKEWPDAIAILVVILVNAGIGFLMEYRAERSMETLRRLAKVNAKVIRDGRMRELPSDQVVPGDILFAEAGDIILADARILSGSQLQVDESALTGESVAVDKEERVLPSETSLAERVNMLYKGTFVTKGNVKAVVAATGMQTELGRIAAMVQSAEQAVTPLETRIMQFSRRILWLTVALIVLIFISGLLEGDEIISMLQTSIALAVAAIPEGLPIVTTLALAQGMLQLARRNVIIKKLAAVETLGGTNVICTDKTGTLTQNRIEVAAIAVPGGSVEIRTDTGRRQVEFVSGDSGIRSWPAYGMIRQIAVLCSTAEFSFAQGKAEESGDPLETGLLKFAYSEGLSIEAIRGQHPKLKEEPFESETKIMATLHRDGDRYFIAAKGAVEELLKRCTACLENGQLLPFDENAKQAWIGQAEKLAQSGLRMIAAAYRETEDIPERLSENLVFAGLIGMLDPPREEVYGAIRECRSAGIDIVMITGDHPATAKNIAHKLGLVETGNDAVIHGKEMRDYEQLTPEEKERWRSARIFARVTPKQKLDLVTVFQEEKQIVGMTGDGVNDAPALKKADIGIAMGQRGTQVAQEVADMILKDDSFSSIVVAVKRGRIIFENIRKFIMYLLSCNLSELFVVSFSSIFDLHYALFPLQILYINLVTDVLPALALGVTEGSDQIMKKLPRDPQEQLIDRKRWISIIVSALVLAACSLGAVAMTHFTMHDNGSPWNEKLCNNILFITLILSQLWNVFNMTPDPVRTFYRTDVFRNKYVWYAITACLVLTLGVYFVGPVARVLSLHTPGPGDLLLMFGFSLLSLVIIQAFKRIKLIV